MRAINPIGRQAHRSRSQNGLQLLALRRIRIESGNKNGRTQVVRSEARNHARRSIGAKPHRGNDRDGQ